MIIYRIELPQEQDADEFVAFMREDYLPAVHRGPTRVGEVLGLTLLQGDPDPETTVPAFFLHVEWAGLEGDYARLRLDDQAAADRLEAFGAHLQRLGFYREVVRWSGPPAESPG